MVAKNYLFISIEGIDGSGKTTCAKMLANKMSAHYYKTPSGIFEQMRSQLENMKDSPTRFAFYFAANFYASAEIKKIITERPVVCDRYINSTIAYHRALGVDISFIGFDRLPIISPDICCYLYAEENICRQRIVNRGIISPSDSALEKDKDLQRRIHREFLKLPAITIDTSNLTPDEVCNQILTNFI